MKKYCYDHNAFSLIELLVVLSIIAVLVGLSAFGLQEARESARDAQRKAELETIRTGLSFYKADCNAYPTSTGSNFGNMYPSSFGSSCAGTNTYIEEVPNDPIDGNLYYYTSTGTTYTICASMEAGGPTPVQCSTANCGDTCTYYVTNP